MNIDKLFTKETTVKISVVKIDNKKLTKSIFNQLNKVSPFDSNYNLKENVKFFGYINDKTTWIIWGDDEFIYKYEMMKSYPFLRINLDRGTISELKKVYDSEEVKKLYNQKDDEFGYLYRDEQISSVLISNEQNEIISKKELVTDIFNKILERQIFI